MARFRLHERRHRWLGAGVLAGILICAWVIGLFGFVNKIPRGVGPAVQETDAIIVLTGGSGRLAMGLDLLSQHRARKLFISGVYRGVEVQKLVEMSQRSPGEIECCIAIGHAVDTIANARESVAWMRANGFSSARVVTSNYHMPRSLLEFRHAMPEADFLPHPVFPSHVKRERWWAWPGSAALITEEYMKFLLAWLRHRLTDVFGEIPALEEDAEAPG